ncbi:helix-turn-helix transcriptional regulator [Arthrobacter sp. H14]|uniref:helix-turn-helix transcriptional regulator n=1 Tax=Arthrobacter sp. H14 TaxID=1312959 RepID=UPI00047A267E|nr:LuxR family transcriptional regulator [Arthrobacter sp. H14]
MTLEYAPWPFVGRAGVVHETAAKLQSGRSVILVGGPGLGKTSLANRVLGLLADSTVSFQVRGTPSLSDVPYGALGVLLSELDDQDLTHPLLLLRGLARFLTHRAGRRRIVLFVDNVQDLDDFSALVISQLAAQKTVVLLCACESMSRAPQEISHLWTDGSLSRVDVVPMSLDETMQLLREELQGPLSRSTVQELWTFSGGNPLFLHILTHEQLVSGNLVHSNRGWLLAAPVAAQSRQVADIMVTRLNRLTREQLKIVEVVSLAGSLPLDLLEEVAGQPDIDSLEEQGILETEAGVERSIRVKHALVADAIRRNVPQGRACELREQLVEAGSGRPYPPINVLAFATWTLNCGGPLDPVLAVAAAKEANELQAPDMALRCLGMLDGEQKRHPEAATEEIRALTAKGQFADAHRVVSRLLADNSEPSFANWVDLTLACVLLSRNDPHAHSMARNALQDVRTRLDGARGAGAWTPELARLSEKVGLMQIEFWVSEGRYAEIGEVLEKMFHDLSTSESFRYSVGFWLSEVWAVTGRQEDGVQLAGDLVHLLDRHNPPESLRGPSEAPLLESLLLAGRWAECAEILDINRKSQPHGSVARDEVYEGILHVHSGRGSQALALLLPSIDQLRARGLHELVVLALAAAAYAYCLEDVPEELKALLEEIDQHEIKASWPVQRAVDYFVTLASSALTSPQQVRAGLLNHADECRSHGAVAFELFSLSAVVRLGHHESAERLAATAEKAQGPFARLCGLYGRGMAFRDPEQLLEASRMARSIGHGKWCRDAAQSVLDCAGTSANADHVKAARRLIYTAHGDPDNPGHGSLIPGLTPGERQIVSLAAKGTTSRAIADTLSVSVRTVEGHLYRIYAKLHVDGRGELEEMLT